MRRSGAPRPQSGVTVIGFLFLVVLFGTIGLAVIKIFPLYLDKVQITKVLQNVQSELSGGGNTIQGIRNALDAQFVVESLEIPRNEIMITREGEGYLLRIKHEARASFVADLSFVVDIDEKVEINR